MTGDKLNSGPSFWPTLGFHMPGRCHTCSPGLGAGISHLHLPIGLCRPAQGPPAGGGLKHIPSSSLYLRTRSVTQVALSASGGGG